MSLSISLRHGFAGFTLDAAFEAPAGVTALFGRSGAGKTTIANAVAGLLKPQAGRIAVDGVTLADTERGIWLPPHRRRIGYVFQEGRLFPHMNVRQNLTYGRWFAGAARDGEEFDRIVALLGIGGLLARRPAALSGGEKQRVAIGRALLSAPRLLLMDEPLASLDEARKNEIIPYLERIRDEAGVPVLYVTHSVVEIARLATTVVAMKEGRVVRCGPAADVLSDPGAVPAIGVREAGSILTGTVIAHHEDGLSEIALSSGSLLLPKVDAAPGATVRIRVAAQDVTIALDPPQRISALNVVQAVIEAIREGAGPGMMVQLRAGEDRILSRVTRRSAEALSLAPGQTCYGIIKANSVAQADIGKVR